MTKAKKGKFISVANMKGGVGKTTTVVSLAESMAAVDQSISVLVVDLDAQASASICVAGAAFLGDLIRDGSTIDHLLRSVFLDRKSRPVLDFVRGGVSQVTHGGDQLNVSLLPASPLLRHAERELVYTLTKRRLSMDDIDKRFFEVFGSAFNDLKEHFDYVIFDCAPGISPFTEVAIRCSDLVVVPTIPDFLSVFGLKMFCETIWQDTEMSQTPLSKMPYVLVTKYQTAMKQHKDTVVDLYNRSRLSNPYFRLLDAVIPQSAYMANAMADTGVPTFSKKYSPAGARLLDPLVREIRSILK